MIYFDNEGVDNFGGDGYYVGVDNLNYKCFKGLSKLYKSIWLLCI